MIKKITILKIVVVAMISRGFVVKTVSGDQEIIHEDSAVESLNSVIRKSIRNRKIFPSDQSALKIIYLAIKEASARWTLPIRDWIPAMNRFAIEYEDRFDIEENKVTQNK